MIENLFRFLNDIILFYDLQFIAIFILLNYFIKT